MLSASTLKKIGILAAVLIALAAGVFFYLTRPIAAPSAPSQENGFTGTLQEGQKRYRINGASSKVTFALNEVLSGQAVEVVGETNQVSGEFAFDAEHPASSGFGAVRINARSLKTDSSRRDAAIGRFILKSEDPDKEYVVFEPKQLERVSGKIEAGKTFAFAITGDLVMAGIRKSQTFDGSAVLAADGQLKGESSATVRRSDYQLTIPSVPFVANVDEEVKLKIEFVAEPVK